MRALLAALAVAALGAASCSNVPVFAEPQLLVSPYYAVYRLRGDVAMDSPGGGPAATNGEQPLSTFGMEDYESDFGIRLDIGDGFAGVRLDYYRLDMRTGDSGMLSDDFGTLLAGDVVQGSARMDEYRFGYIHPLLHQRESMRGKPFDFRFGAGAVLAHRELDLRTRTIDGVRSQHLDASDDGVIYAAARAKLTWADLGLEAEYAISPDWTLGGDFDGVLWDLELRGTYAVPYQPVTFFAGWRYSVLPAEGETGGLDYDADFSLDGFQFGVVVVL